MSVSFISLSPEEAIAKYKEKYQSYVELELVKVAQYRELSKGIRGSLADQVIERAIWYMDHGYIVWGNGWNSYHSHGVADCSNFMKLVYGDFGFELTGVAKKYDQMGTRIKCVYPMKVGRFWHLEGLENIRPGDLLTWWQDRKDNSRFVKHVAIYMGQIEGSPAVIGTTQGAPTAVGINNKFRRWWGKCFYTAQRILPEGSWTPGKIIAGQEDRGPVIPREYVLPPQKPIIMPENQGK